MVATLDVMRGGVGVNIQEATNVALEKGEFITRETKEFAPYRILPTDTDECFIVYIAKEFIEVVGTSIPGKRWNPKAEDILANDWAVKPL